MSTIGISRHDRYAGFLRGLFVFTGTWFFGLSTTASVLSICASLGFGPYAGSPVNVPYWVLGTCFLLTATIGLSVLVFAMRQPERWHPEMTERRWMERKRMIFRSAIVGLVLVAWSIPLTFALTPVLGVFLAVLETRQSWRITELQARDLRPAS